MTRHFCKVNVTNSKNGYNNLILLDYSKTILARLQEPEPLMQVVLGPRQVGKTTTVKQIVALLPKTSRIHYAAADAVFRSDWSWIERQWMEAEALGDSAILILDEVQKMNYSDQSSRSLTRALRYGLSFVLQRAGNPTLHT